MPSSVLLRAPVALPAIVGLEHQAAVGHLAADYAHEVRNALTGLRCYLELLQGSDIPAHVASFVGDLEAVVDRTARLSTVLVEVARGRNAAPTLGRSVARVLDLFAGCGVSRRIRFDRPADLEDDATPLTGDPAAFQTAIFVCLSALIRGEPERLAVEIDDQRHGCRLALRAIGGRDPSPLSLDTRALGEALQGSVTPLEPPGRGFVLQISALGH